MPDKNIYEETKTTLEELEDKIGGEYPEVAETLMTATAQLEEAHSGMGEEGAEFPPDLEGEEDIEGDDEIIAGPLGELPPGLEDEEEEEELPPIA